MSTRTITIPPAGAQRTTTMSRLEKMQSMVKNAQRAEPEQAEHYPVKATFDPATGEYVVRIPREIAATHCTLTARDTALLAKVFVEFPKKSLMRVIWPPQEVEKKEKVTGAHGITEQTCLDATGKPIMISTSKVTVHRLGGDNDERHGISLGLMMGLKDDYRDPLGDAANAASAS